jgi:hypothetical protein
MRINGTINASRMVDGVAALIPFPKPSWCTELGCPYGDGDSFKFGIYPLIPAIAPPLTCADFTVPGGSCIDPSLDDMLILWTDRTYDWGGSSSFAGAINLFDGSWLYAKFGHDTPTCAPP